MIETKLQAKGLEVRPYQTETAQNAFARLQSGINVEISLPPGTGKTLIANIISWYWLLDSPNSRVLHIAPWHRLVERHQLLSRWMAPEIFPMRLDRASLEKPFLLKPMLYSHRVIISTPRLFAGSVINGTFPRNRLEEIDLVILDEYDSFLTIDYQIKSVEVQLHKHYEMIINFTKERARYVLVTSCGSLSAVQSGTQDWFALQATEFVTKRFAPITAECDSSVYNQLVSATDVIFVFVEDAKVKECDESIKWEIDEALQRFNQDTGYNLDITYLETRINCIIDEQLREICAFQGDQETKLEVNKKVVHLCMNIQDKTSERLFLFEDMFAEFRSVWKRVSEPHIPSAYRSRKPYILDHREGSGAFFQVKLNGKGRVLREIIQRHHQEKGIVVTRFTKLSDALVDDLTKLNRSIYKIDGRKNERQHKEILARFEESSDGILVITRDTVEKGFDLPVAGFIILYSLRGSIELL